MSSEAYNPFAEGEYGVDVKSVEAHDRARDRRFPVQVWAPDEAGTYPLIVYSHSAGGNRQSSTFLTTHLASHGYVVAAMDHSERVAEELRRPEGETAAGREARVEAIIASRVPDIRFLIDYVLGGGAGLEGIMLDADRIGLVGHSFGGWTVLATPEVDERIGSVVAMAPGGSDRPMPGIIPCRLTFAWHRPLPTLYLAAENDVPVPLDRVTELFERTPGQKQMVILRRADHQHFVDDVEGEHESLRTTTLDGDSAWIPSAMRPMAELASGAQAHTFVRGLTLAHLDATLRHVEAAESFLEGDAEGELAARDVDVVTYAGEPR